MRRLLRFLVRLVIAVAVLRAVATAIVRFVGERDDPEAEDFDLLAVMDGRHFVSRARRLRGGRIRVVAGGADVDLRQAGISPEGAGVEIEVWLGGVRLLVAPGWRVEVEAQVRPGGSRVDVSDPDTLPSDAPVLRIHAVVKAGGLEVTTRPDEALR